jgi:hypothetical protein
VLAALISMLGAGSAAAHPAPFSYLDLRLGPAGIEGSLVVHVIDVAHELAIDPPERLLTDGAATGRFEAIVALVNSRLAMVADGRSLSPEWLAIAALPDRQALRLTFRSAGPEPGVVTIRAALFPYDPYHQTFVNVYEGGELTRQEILSGSRTTVDYYAGTRSGILAVVARFLPAGVHHIAIGPDHILFLVGLMLLGGTLRQLLLIVTAFTLAHSVTLSLAALDLVTPPASIIEPAIALSIVYVGADNLLVKGGRDVRAGIAFVFGLIHGFGFASVLRDLGLPARALGWSLFSFNVGVEVGQLVIVAGVATALAALRSRSAEAGRRVVMAGSIAVIGAGAFWFVERVFFSGGTL